MEFEGNRGAADSYLHTITGRYYVYVLCRPDGRPFYVGKGLNRRALEHEVEARRHHPIGETNPFKCNVIRKIIRDGCEVTYRIEAHYNASDQQACLEHEAALIKEYGRATLQTSPVALGIFPVQHLSALSDTRRRFQVNRKAIQSEQH